MKEKQSNTVTKEQLELHAEVIHECMKQGIASKDDHIKHFHIITLLDQLDRANATAIRFESPQAKK